MHIFFERNTIVFVFLLTSNGSFIELNYVGYLVPLYLPLLSLVCKDKHVVWAVRVCTELQRLGLVVSPTEHAAHRGSLGTHTPNALMF